MDGPRPVARLGIGFAESHAAPHERALGSFFQALLSAASSAQPSIRRGTVPRTHLSYMTSRNALRHVLARTTPSPSAKEPPYQRVYIVFFLFAALLSSARPRAVSIIYRTGLRWTIHLFIEQRHHGECKLPLRYLGPVNLQLAARVVCVCRVHVANMGGRACFRSHPPCSTGLPVLVVRARYPYSSSSLGAALRRPSVIGPAHIVSVSSHATAMQQ